MGSAATWLRAGSCGSGRTRWGARAKSSRRPGEDLAQAKEKLNARLATAKASLDHMNESVVQRAKQSAVVTNEYVHEQPWKALGASAVIAFLLGLAVARRN